MSRVASLGALIGGVLVCVPGPVQAHLASTRFGDFYAGMLHPLTALEHVLPLLALGLLAGLQEPRAGRWTLLAVPLGLLVGVVLARQDPMLSAGPAEAAVWANRASFLVLGLMVALGRRLPTALLCSLAAVFAVTHGIENGTVLGDGAKLHLFAFGAAAIGLVLVALSAAAIVSLKRRIDWLPVAVRSAGSWIAAAGLMVLAL